MVQFAMIKIFLWNYLFILRQILMRVHFRIAHMHDRCTRARKLYIIGKQQQQQQHYPSLVFDGPLHHSYEAYRRQMWRS